MIPFMSRESNLPLFFYPHNTTIVVHNRYKKLHKWYDLGIAIYYNSSIIELTKEITPQEVHIMIDSMSKVKKYNSLLWLHRQSEDFQSILWQWRENNMDNDNVSDRLYGFVCDIYADEQREMKDIENQMFNL